MPWDMPEDIESAKGREIALIEELRSRMKELRQKAEIEAIKKGWPVALPLEFYKAAKEGGGFAVTLIDGQEFVFPHLEFNGKDFVLLHRAMRGSEVEIMADDGKLPPAGDISVRISAIMAILDLDAIDG